MRLNLMSAVVGTLLILAAGSGCQPKPAPSPTSPVIIPPPPQANVTRAYDVRDLIIWAPDFDDVLDYAPAPAEFAPGLAASPTFIKAVPQNSLFNEPAANRASDGPTRQQVLETLVQSIQENVTPSAWTSGARIRDLQGQLIITAPPVTHEELTAFLAESRGRRSSQVTLEFRVLDLTGIPLTSLDPALAKKLRIARLPGMPHSGFELTEKESNELIRATEASVRGSMITTPRLTLFSGQHAYILVNQQKPYVGGYTPKTDKHGFDPQMKIAESGTLLSASAAVSEDHKQVAVDLDMKISEFLGMGKTPFTGAPSEEKLMIDVPGMRVRDLRAIASVSDKTTVMFTAFHDITEQLGWSAPATQPSIQATTPENSDKRSPVLGDNLILLVKPIVIIEKQ